MKKIAIIGAGIIGLSCAYRLKQEGYQISIYAKAFAPHNTSAKAAAFWFPYHIQHDERCIRWCRTSYEKYLTLSDNPATGISRQRVLKLVKKGHENADMHWIDFMPEGCCRPLEEAALMDGFCMGHELQVPLIQTQRFLPWLMEQLQLMGVAFIEEKILDVEGLAERYSLLINCSGLGARDLCGDKSIYPVRGQIAYTAPCKDLPIYLDNEQPFYIVPREDITIIGGTYEEHVEEEKPEPATVEALYRQALGLVPQLGQAGILGSWSGFRPYRKMIRLEKEADKNIIHNYGHGGSGFTLAWGCAEEVLKLGGG